MSKILNLAQARERKLIEFTTLLFEISKVFEETSTDNEYFTEQSELSRLFYGKKPTRITVEEYLLRLASYLKFEVGSLISALIYIDRFCERNNITINKNNIHRLLLVALVVAIKYNEDLHYTNTIFSQVGGIPLDYLNLLESVFLHGIMFSLFIHETIYENYLKNVIKRVANRMK